MKVKTPLGEYPFEFSRLARRDGGIAVVGSVGGIESTILFDSGDLARAGRRLAPPLIAATALVILLRRRR